jgi:hypothetical protein
MKKSCGKSDVASIGRGFGHTTQFADIETSVLRIDRAVSLLLGSLREKIQTSSSALFTVYLGSTGVIQSAHRGAVSLAESAFHHGHGGSLAKQ